MSNLIPADKLIAEIERRVEETKSMKPAFDQFWAGQISAFKGAIKIAESLQQEQPDVDLLDALDDYYNKAEFGPSDAIEYETHKDIARHFYELGLNAKKK